MDGFEPNTPLKEALNFLQERYEVKFIINARALERSGIADFDVTPIKLPKLVNVSFEHVLEAVLSQVGEKDTVRYRVRPQGIELTTDRGDTLIRGRALHRYTDDEPDVRMRNEMWMKLESPITLDGFEANTPLKEALGYLSERYGITILMDTAAFPRIGVREPENQPVKLWRVAEIPMVHVLQQILLQSNARPRVRHSMLEVIPAEPTGMNVAFSRDGRFLATASPAGQTGQQIRMWDRRSGRVLHSVTIAEAVRTQLVFTAENKLALLARHTSEETRYRLTSWDVASGRNAGEKTWNTAGELALSPDGTTIASLMGETLCVHNVRTGKEWKHAVPGHLGALEFSGDGRTLFALDRQPRVLAEDAATPPDAAMGQVEPNKVHLWKVAVGHDAIRFSLDRKRGGEDLAVSSTSLSHDARLLAAKDCLGRLDLWETITGRRIHRLKTTGIVREVAFSPTSRLLAALVDNGSGSAVEVWDLATPKSLGRFDTDYPGKLLALAFAPDGKALVASADDGTPIQWDVSRLDGSRRVAELTADKLEDLWDRLLSEDAERGYPALRQMETSPDTVVPFLKARLKPYVAPPKGVLESTLRQLDDEQWVRRNEAEQVLLRLGKWIEPRLREELRRPLPSLELRRRIERIVARFQEPVTTPELLRELRAIHLLESVATSDAQQLLRKLAEGADGPTTQAARISLQRQLPPKP